MYSFTILAFKMMVVFFLGFVANFMHAVCVTNTSSSTFSTHKIWPNLQAYWKNSTHLEGCINVCIVYFDDLQHK